MKQTIKPRYMDYQWKSKPTGKSVGFFMPRPKKKKQISLKRAIDESGYTCLGITFKKKEKKRV